MVISQYRGGKKEHRRAHIQKKERFQVRIVREKLKRSAIGWCKKNNDKKMYTTTYPESWMQGKGGGTMNSLMPMFGAEQPARLVMSQESWRYAGPLQDSVSPLDTMKLVDRTYVGDMGNAGSLGNIVDMYRERASEDLTGPRTVGIMARTWANGFHRMLAKGQPMFCIDDPTWDKDVTLDSNKPSPYNIRDHTMYPACMVSAPQLVALLKSADSTLKEMVSQGGVVGGSSASASIEKVCCPHPRRGIVPQVRTRPPTQPVTAPTTGTKTLSDVTKQNEESWPTEQVWKDKLEGSSECSIIRLANIMHLRKTIRYVGILTDTPDVGIPDDAFGSVMMEVASIGDVRCMNYWGRKISKGDNLGFVLRRTEESKEDPIISHYMIYPWNSKSRKWPTDAELKSHNFKGATDKSTRDGIFFYVGKVVHLELAPEASDAVRGTYAPDMHYGGSGILDRGIINFNALGIFSKEDEIDVSRAVEETRMTRDVLVVNLGHGPSSVW
jgi:hypothetical protein